MFFTRPKVFSLSSLFDVFEYMVLSGSGAAPQEIPTIKIVSNRSRR